MLVRVGAVELHSVLALSANGPDVLRRAVPLELPGGALEKHLWGRKAAGNRGEKASAQEASTRR